MTDHRTTADLREYLEAIDLCYFDQHLSELGVQIRWMRARSDAAARVGCYRIEEKTIEVARDLAHASVPRVFVMQTIHHEACHAIYGANHGPAFHRACRQFLFAYEAFEWERTGGHWPAPPKGLR